jgi:hypothetical protein
MGGLFWETGSLAKEMINLVARLGANASLWSESTLSTHKKSINRPPRKDVSNTLLSTKKILKISENHIKESTVFQFSIDFKPFIQAMTI